MKNIFGFEMNEEFFANMQKHLPGFGDEGIFPKSQEYFDEALKRTIPNYSKELLKDKAKLDKVLLERISSDDLELSDIRLVIMSFIFGCYGCEINLDLAERMSLILLDVAKSYKPNCEPNRNNEEYMLWLMQIAIPHILLGTIYSYKKEYIKATYHFIKGLKTEMVQLNMPYTDFIKYIIEKLENIKIEKGEFKGTGFSIDSPIETQTKNSKILEPMFANSFISDLEGLNEEVIVYFKGRTYPYGYLKRLGSVKSKDSEDMLDMYETFIIDKNYKMKKAIIYFNNYICFENNVFNQPTGFRIKGHSSLLEFIDIV